MHAIDKAQVKRVEGKDVLSQKAFVEFLFGIVA